MRIWLDISLSKRHKGTPHGLARVEVAIARHLLQSKQLAGTIWLDDSYSIHFDIASAVQELTDGSNATKAAFDNYSEKSDSLITIQMSAIAPLKSVPKIERVRVLASYLFSFFPDAVARQFWKLGKNALKTFRSLIHLKKRLLVSDSSVQKITNKSATYEQNFFAGDILLIAGNDWDRRIYSHSIRNQLFSPRLAFVIYDLIPYDYPQFAVDLETSNRFTFWIGDLAQRASFLFFISKFTQAQFNKMCLDRNITSSAKQLVISLPPGIESDGYSIPPDFFLDINKKYVLVVCTIEARKNHQILILALRAALEMGEDFPQLIFIGSPGWGSESIVRDLKLDSSLEGHILVKSGISDSQLRWLYENCTAVAYPSLVEGFGLPVLESAVFKKPVVVSDIPVFKEINHPAKFTVSPFDPIGWKNAIQMVTSRNFSKKFSHPPDFSDWRNTVKQMLSLMR